MILHPLILLIMFKAKYITQLKNTAMVPLNINENSCNFESFIYNANSIITNILKPTNKERWRVLTFNLPNTKIIINSKKDAITITSKLTSDIYYSPL